MRHNRSPQQPQGRKPPLISQGISNAWPVIPTCPVRPGKGEDTHCWPDWPHDGGHSTPSASRSGAAACSRAESTAKEKGKVPALGSRQSAPKPAPSPQPPGHAGCLGWGWGCRSPAFTALRTGCNLIAFPDGVCSESESGKYDRKDSHVWPISISWLVTALSLYFTDTCF